jgi:hypothetical protein
MNVYPVFEINSILERFKKDMNHFKRIYKNNIDEYNLISYIDEIEKSIQIFNDSNKTFMNFKKNIDSIKEKINKIRKNDLTQFDYSHDITHFQLNDQILLWCLRTLLFYQLLIIETLMMLEETIFNDVYQNYHKKRVFNPFIIDQLPFYKMGIFGSITPTSDIDIGIQYSGSNPELIGLSYIVSVFEDLFLIFTGINSLQFDIEMKTRSVKMTGSFSKVGVVKTFVTFNPVSGLGSGYRVGSTGNTSRKYLPGIRPVLAKKSK